MASCTAANIRQTVPFVYLQWANHDAQLYGVDLAPNIGLAGKGLSGTMDVKGNYFVAEGIPLTEFPDATPDQPNYFQLAHIVAKSPVEKMIETMIDTKTRRMITSYLVNFFLN